MNERLRDGRQVLGWMLAHTRRLIVLVLGLALLVLAVALGWLPGPGGIPLALAGLWILATEFEWAARLRVRLQLRVRSAVDRVRANRDARVRPVVTNVHPIGPSSTDDVTEVQLPELDRIADAR